MRDSTYPEDIPLEGLDVVAGYADGIYEWSSAGWSRFTPPIIPLSIVVFASDVGDILDVERGNAAPSDVPGWLDRFNRPGRRRGTVYCNRNTIAEVRMWAGARPFDWWAATLDGTTDGTDGAVAVQWKGSDRTGGHYDESVILDDSWAGSVPAPAPAPAPVPHSANTYTVVPGDTLSGIAARYGMSWQSLYNFGGNRATIGGNPNLIYPGQVLDVP